MNQQRIPERYDPGFMVEVLRRVAMLESNSFMRGNDLELNIQSRASTGARQPRLILRAPNGVRYSVEVSITGVLSTSVVP